MSFISFNFPAKRVVRTLIAVCFCALMFVSNVFPAFAVTSSPTKGEDQLLGIEKESQEIVLKKPMSLEETQEKASKGPNEVQGDADLEKMKNPSNTEATSFEQQVKKAVSKIKD
ncbi:low temperature-induced protein [Microcoleus vaginatus]|uniref:low temperature-induced protein n=1 Tax=Microcoleus vaginatus TaxID=119532 RepID=UPI0016875110|nr:low temperature-induced protein [Microcoleus sp. FACHB-84]MBD2009750.1 low temperature-induced protein [Microcoleus sp. FACHB-45]